MEDIKPTTDAKAIEAILCLGSNTADADQKISEAVRCIQETGCVFMAHSSRYQLSSAYTNMVAKIRTEIPYEHLHAYIKSIEMLLGREPSMKAQGIVPIDIDIVVYDNEIKKQRDYEAPYFVYGFNQIQPQK